MGLRQPKATIGTEELRKDLMAERARSEEQAKGQAAGLGISGPKTVKQAGERSFEARGLRIGGQLVGQRELARAKSAINDTVEDLVRRSNFVNAAQEAEFRREQKRKLNSVMNLIAESGMQFEQQVAGAQAGFNERIALFNALGGLAEGVGTFAGRSGAFKRTDESAIGDPVLHEGDTRTSTQPVSGRTQGPAVLSDQQGLFAIS